MKGKGKKVRSKHALQPESDASNYEKPGVAGGELLKKESKVSLSLLCNTLKRGEGGK